MVGEKVIFPSTNVLVQWPDTSSDQTERLEMMHRTAEALREAEAAKTEKEEAVSKAEAERWADLWIARAPESVSSPDHLAWALPDKITEDSPFIELMILMGSRSDHLAVEPLTTRTENLLIPTKEMRAILIGIAEEDRSQWDQVGRQFAKAHARVIAENVQHERKREAQLLEIEKDLRQAKPPSRDDPRVFLLVCTPAQAAGKTDCALGRVVRLAAQVRDKQNDKTGPGSYVTWTIQYVEMAIILAHHGQAIAVQFIQDLKDAVALSIANARKRDARPTPVRGDPDRDKGR